MARNESPPFPRGETIYGGDTIDSNDLTGLQIEGTEWVFEDVNPTSGVKRTGRPVRCRAVRNVSTVAMLPKVLASLQGTAGVATARVDGYARTLNAQAFPVDEYLPAAGCPVNDIFWLVIEGPAVCITSTVDIAALIAAGGWVNCQTVAASTGTTAGRVIPQDTNVLTATLANAIQNRIGRALSAATTSQTNADILVDVGHW